MNILWLGYLNATLIRCLEKTGDEAVIPDQSFGNGDFLVSYGYPHILPQHVLDLYPNRAINLHISYLPWNRGADPNLWSWVDDTPKGVTIHHIDAGVDTGDIIAQQLVEFDQNETLGTSYDKLRFAVEKLFIAWWPEIKAGRAGRSRQTGTSHTKKDRARVEHLLTNGWDTPVTALRVK